MEYLDWSSPLSYMFGKYYMETRQLLLDFAWTHYISMTTTSLNQKHFLSSSGEENYPPKTQGATRLDFQQSHIVFKKELEEFLQIYQPYLAAQKQISEEGYTTGSTVHRVTRNFGWHIFKNGDAYIGCWKDDQMSGPGVYWLKNKLKVAYIGFFRNGLFNGEGKLAHLSEEGSGDIIYIGNWKNGMKEEYGVHYYENMTMAFEGDWHLDKRDGYGVLTFQNGYYEGDFVQDTLTGDGKLSISDNNMITVYEGTFKENALLKGKIVYSSSKGEIGRYKGEMKYGKKNGKGSYTWPNGMIFEGTFVDDTIRGQGMLSSKNMDLKGTFDTRENIPLQAGNTEMTCAIRYDNGDTFQGEVKIASDIVMRKKGVYKFANGDTAEGVFEDSKSGQLHGKYTYKAANGVIQSFD